MTEYRCPRGHKIGLVTDRIGNIGKCPICRADWEEVGKKERDRNDEADSFIDVRYVEGKYHKEGPRGI